MNRIFGVLLCFLLVISGCGGPETHPQTSTQGIENSKDDRVVFTVSDIRSTPTDLTGIYIEENYPDFYFEIRKDGTAVLCEGLELFGKYNQVNYDMWLEIDDNRGDGKTWLSFQYYDGSWWTALVQFYQQDDDTFIWTDLIDDWDETLYFTKRQS